MNNGKMCTRVMLVWVLMLVISMSAISLIDAQVLPPCADQILLPCIDYVNSTKPPDICCNPIKDLHATHKTCFCQLIAAAGLFEAFGLKITQVFRVIHLCGINFNITSCIASSPTLPLSSLQPPAITRGDEGGAAGKATLTRICLILFIWAFELFP